MTIPEIEGLTEPPIIGKYYWVPGVQFDKGVQTRWLKDPFLPIFGPSHDDKEIIGFPEVHWHIDWRFVGGKSYESATEGRGIRPYTYVASTHLCNEPALVKLKCKRQFPEFLRTFTNQLKYAEPIFWFPELEVAYQGHTLDCGKCPHRGLDLSTVRTIDGIQTCPGHGLKWRSHDGSLAIPDTPR